MNRWIQYPLIVSGICLAVCPVVFAAPSGVATAKCAANQDRIWVYDSLTSFDVEAKIPCGDTVQIVSRVKGYVKIRTASGLDGYVPDSTFPDLPPYQDKQYDLGNHNATTSETVVNDPSDLGAIAAAYRAKRIAEESAASAAAAASVAPATAVAPKEVVSAVAPQPAAAAAPAPMPVSSAPSVAAVPVKTKTVASAAAPKHVNVAPAPASPIEAREQAAPAPVVARPSIVATRVSAPVPAAPAVSSSPAVVVSTASPAVMDPPIPVPSVMAAAAAPADASMREIATRPVGTMPAESEDYPDTQPEDASADPNCRVYFSAYGLGAEQYKWLSETRQKQFSGICPAPNLQSVDFVILFTHDTDSYISAMPTPVHTDGSGFSDFDPLTTVDTALMSPTEADRAHYELAWVFRVRRGGFDPSAFSPRRRPQYESTAKGAHASTKAVEDAFNFIQQNGTR